MFALFSKFLELGKILLLAVLAARSLSIPEFGNLMFVVAIAAILQVLADFRQQEITIQRLAKGESVSTVMSETLTLSLISSLLVILAIFLLGLILPNSVWWYDILTLYIPVLLFSPLKCFRYYFISKNKNIVISICETLSFTTILLLYIIFSDGDFRVEHYFTLRATDMLIVGASLSFLFWINKSQEFSIKDAIELKKQFKKSMPLVLSAIVITGFQKLDQIMIGILQGSLELGKYSAAITLVMALAMIPIVLAQATVPNLIKVTTGPDLNNKIAYLRKNFIIGALCTILLLLFLPLLTKLIYGNNYELEFEVFCILSLIPFFTSLGSATSQLIILDHRTNVVFVKALMALVANFFLNIILIKQWGIAGATATVSALFLSNFLSNYFLPSYRIYFHYQVRAIFLRKT